MLWSASCNCTLRGRALIYKRCIPSKRVQQISCNSEFVNMPSLQEGEVSRPSPPSPCLLISSLESHFVNLCTILWCILSSIEEAIVALCGIAFRLWKDTMEVIIFDYPKDHLERMIEFSTLRRSLWKIYCWQLS